MLQLGSTETADQPTVCNGVARTASGRVLPSALSPRFVACRPACRGAAQVVTPAAGGPAEGAGIRPQDAILAIGDKSTEGMSLFEAAALLQVRLRLRTGVLHVTPGLSAQP